MDAEGKKAGQLYCIVSFGMDAEGKKAGQLQCIPD
jgi:hypothetical protein